MVGQVHLSYNQCLEAETSRCLYLENLVRKFSSAFENIKPTLYHPSKAVNLKHTVIYRLLFSMHVAWIFVFANIWSVVVSFGLKIIQCKLVFHLSFQLST